MSVFGKSYGSNISGELYIKGEKVNLKNPHDAIRHGLAYVTEDRKTNGLILGESIRFNTTLARLSKVCEKGVVNTDMEVHLADEMTKEMGTKTCLLYTSRISFPVDSSREPRLGVQL